MTEIEEDARTLEDYWKQRNLQMEEDRSIINLDKPTQTTDQTLWVSNEPKVFYETACALISSYPPRFRLPLTMNFTPEEKDKMNRTERFALGIYRSLDGRQMSLGRMYWLREAAYWVLSGWYAYFPWVRENGKDVDFLIDLWDPMHVYPQWDSNGLVKCVRSFEADKASALSMASGWKAQGLDFEIKDPTEKVKIINWWRNDRGKIYNAIQFGSDVVKHPTHHKKLKTIPIEIGAVGLPDMTTALWQKRRGENIIAANRDMYEYENAMVSLMATIIAETAYPNVVSQTRTGSPVLKKAPKGYGEEIPLQIGEKIELLKHAATPTEANLILSWIGTHKQKGSIPDTVYGHVPFELSGFAISQLMASIRYKIAPYLNTLQYSLARSMQNLLTQYREGDFPKVSLTTVNPQDLRKGLFFVEEYSRKDVPDSLYIDVTIPITSALDKTQQIIFARQALQPPQILSRETLWDEYLDVQDSEQEYARIIQDEMLGDQFVKDIAIVEQMRERETLLRNQGNIPAADALKTYRMQKELQLGMRQGIPTTPGGGVPPQFSPPEAGKSPDMMRAALGVGSPGLSRRPQTAEERAQSVGRKGMLVSPSGKTLL